MRELAKSFVRFSWAMSVFGLQQMRELLRSEEKEEDEVAEEEAESSSQRVASSMDAVSEDTEKHLSKRARSLYDAGDKFQEEVLDLLFDAVDPDEWKPRKVIDKMADFAEKSADALRDLAEEEEEDEEGSQAEELTGEEKAKGGE